MAAETKAELKILLAQDLESSIEQTAENFADQMQQARGAKLAMSKLATDIVAVIKAAQEELGDDPKVGPALKKQLARVAAAVAGNRTYWEQAEIRLGGYVEGIKRAGLVVEKTRRAVEATKDVPKRSPKPTIKQQRTKKKKPAKRKAAKRGKGARNSR